jgi:hypothetical protein
VIQSYEEFCAMVSDMSSADYAAMEKDPHRELLRHIVSYPRTLSIHDGLVYEHNFIHQGVLKGHSAEDVQWLVDQGYVKIIPGTYCDGIEATEIGKAQYQTWKENDESRKEESLL